MRIENVSALGLGVLRAAHPPLVAAEAAARLAATKVVEAKEALAARQRVVDGLPGRIASGTSSASELTPALANLKVAALSLPPLETAAAEARAKVEPLLDQALDAVAGSIRDRRAKLRAALPETKVRALPAVVAQDRELVTQSAALRDQMTGADLLGARDLGEPLSWPPCLGDEIDLANRLFANAPTPAALLAAYNPDRTKTPDAGAAAQPRSQSTLPAGPTFFDEPRSEVRRYEMKGAPAPLKTKATRDTARDAATLRDVVAGEEPAVQVLSLANLYGFDQPTDWGNEETLRELAARMLREVPELAA